MKTNKKYTPKYFKENLPDWKRKKDSIVTQVFYRPLSFVTSSICSNIGITANQVSYFSILIALSACILIIIPNRICNIIGAILVNVWVLSDSTDGNIARSVKKQPFGEFADSISSYVLVGLLCTSLGINGYFNGGVIFESGVIWLVLLGTLASSSDTLMRLIYQKYKACERGLADMGKMEVEKEKRTDINQTTSLIVRIEADFGIGGILPFLVLFGIIFNFVDLVVIYCFLYYFASSLLMITKYILKAINNTRKIENKG